MEQQNFTNLTLNIIGKQTERISNILLEKKEETKRVIHRMPLIKQTKLPQNNKASSSKSAPHIFNSQGLDSGIKLGPSLLEEFIDQLNIKMSFLKLKDTITYLSKESSRELTSSEEEAW